MVGIWWVLEKSDTIIYKSKIKNSINASLTYALTRPLRKILTNIHEFETYFWKIFFF